MSGLATEPAGTSFGALFTDVLALVCVRACSLRLLTSLVVSDLCDSVGGSGRVRLLPWGDHYASWRLRQGVSLLI